MPKSTTYRLSRYQIAEVKAVASEYRFDRQRCISSREQDLYSDALVGSSVELATSLYTNLAWTAPLGRLPDGKQPRDVGFLIEARGILKREHGLIARPEEDENAPCVLGFVDLPTFTIELLGFAYGWEVKKGGVYRDWDSDSPYWTLPQSGLYEMHRIFHIIDRDLRGFRRQVA